MKLKFRTKLSYGIGGTADNAMFTLVETFLLFFLTTVVGIKPGTAGTILALGCVWEAFCGPISGYLSDHIETRFGKRKPFLLIAAVPAAVVTSLLFTAIDAGYGFKVVYYGLMTILFWWCFAVFFVPYLTWGSELTDDYHERTVLRSYAYVFNQFGKGLGMVMPTLLVALLMEAGKTTAQSWSVVGITVGVASGASLLICALSIKETDVSNFVQRPDQEKLLDLKKLRNMFKDYFQILKLRPIRYLIGASLIYLIANTILVSGMIYYFTYNIGIASAQVSVITLLMTAAGIALSPLITVCAGQTDKKSTFTGGMIISGIILIGARFIGVGSFAAAGIMCGLFAIGNTCYWQLMPSMIYDVCEAEELASGERHAGAVISLQALSESLSTAVGVQLLGIILEQAGFNETLAQQSETALFWVSNCFSLIPGIGMILVALVIRGYPITKKTFPRILEGAEKRRRGEEVDMKLYKDIF